MSIVFDSIVGRTVAHGCIQGQRCLDRSNTRVKWVVGMATRFCWCIGVVVYSSSFHLCPFACLSQYFKSNITVGVRIKPVQADYYNVVLGCCLKLPPSSSSFLTLIVITIVTL